MKIRNNNRKLYDALVDAGHEPWLTTDGDLDTEAWVGVMCAGPICSKCGYKVCHNCYYTTNDMTIKECNHKKE